MLLAAVIVVVGATSLVVLGAPHEGAMGFDDIASSLPWLRVATIAAAMLAGVFANAVWAAIPRVSGDNDRVNVGVLLDHAVNSGAFLRAVIVSPIVLLAVYAVVKREPDVFVAHLLAFQNGYFWDSVLRGHSATAPRG